MRRPEPRRFHESWDSRKGRAVAARKATIQPSLRARDWVAEDAVGELRCVAEDPRDGNALVGDEASRQERGASDRGRLPDVTVGADGRRAAHLRFRLDHHVRPEHDGTVDPRGRVDPATVLRPHAWSYLFA